MLCSLKGERDMYREMLVVLVSTFALLYSLPQSLVWWKYFLVFLLVSVQIAIQTSQSDV